MRAWVSSFWPTVRITCLSAAGQVVIVDESDAEVEVDGLVILGCDGRGSSEGLDLDDMVFGGCTGVGTCWLELPWP